MNLKNHILDIVLFLLIVSLFGIGVFLFIKQRNLEHQMSTVVPQLVESAEVAPGEPTVAKIITSAQLWRPVQEKVKDTVVQIFSQIAAIDLLQPYKTPSQGTAYGSGFFISDNGDIITNAHVVEQAKAVWVQIPSLGKRIIDVDIIGVNPDRDLALLRVIPQDLQVIKEVLGAVPYLALGDSDTIRRSDDVLALGYPLGQQSLKSTTGVISGTEHHYIQTSAAINPGSSGGPLVNMRGEVIGINSAGITEAQNVGYAIPINDLKIVLPDLKKTKLVRKPFLGVLFNNATEALAEFLGNPLPGGCYVVEVVKGSTLERGGVKRGDMIYEINGHKVDLYGEMSVPWTEDKVSIVDYVSRLSIGEEIQLVVYRNGTRKNFTVKFTNIELPAVRKVYPGYEKIDYEVFAGMVVMELTLNHIQIMGQNVSGLSKYAEMSNQADPSLVVTHIFPTSQLYRSRALPVGATVHEVNGKKVHTLEDFRAAIKAGKDQKFLTIRAADNVSRASENLFIALSWDKVLQEESRLARDYCYPLSALAKELLAERKEATPVTGAAS